jgi:hypothetical protein
MLRERITPPADYVPTFELPIMNDDPEFGRKMLREYVEQLRVKKLQQEKSQDNSCIQSTFS